MDKYISEVKTPKVSIAPMVDRTVQHFRYFCRLLTKQSLLYTEMVTDQAILHGDRERILKFDAVEKPIALQIAGSKPQDIFKAVKLAEAWDYDEINLNVGCPSDRVAGNEMGAVLMAYPNLVSEIVAAMKAATNKPVTVKQRIGIDGKGILPDHFDRTLLNTYEDMKDFVTTVEASKPDRFTIHARIAILAGLNPKENREIPPLRYEDVYRLKKELPHLNIEINGGVKSIGAMKRHLEHVDGVMIGRLAYDNPFVLTKVDGLFKGAEINPVSRREIIEALIPYVENMEAKGEKAHRILGHTMGLFAEKRGSKQWKRLISPPYLKEHKGTDLLKQALKELPQDVLDERATEVSRF